MLWLKVLQGSCQSWLNGICQTQTQDSRNFSAQTLNSPKMCLFLTQAVHYNQEELSIQNVSFGIRTKGTRKLDIMNFGRNLREKTY